MTPPSRAEVPRRECADCRTMGDALASGFNPSQDGGWSDFVEPCHDIACRNYEPPVLVTCSACRDEFEVDPVLPTDLCGGCK